MDYETLTKLGSIMGSGGMIVMDETSSMVDVARYFMEFCMTESCGKCIPCRAGTAQMHYLLGKFADREATPADLALLESLCDMVRNTSLCGLGQSAPNPVHEHAALFPARVRSRICRGRSEASDGGQVVTLEIDGHDVSARDDQSIIEVARENGVQIPKLCYVSGLSDIGRLPAVPGGGRRNSPSCWPPAPPRSPRACTSPPRARACNEYRRMILEMLFAERNHVCSVCVSNGQCELQSLAQQLGIDHIRFHYVYPQLAGGRQPHVLRAGSESLHPVHALRSRVR